MPTVRTRFAPSPTGDLHLGNVRIAVFNWLFTRQQGGQFVLRIEDTDLDRNVEGAEARLMEDLRWLGLEWDEGPDTGGDYGPYRQSERGPLYSDALERLLTSGAAYRCFCAEGEQTGEDRRYPGTCRGIPRAEASARADAGEDFVVRLRTPDEGEVGIEDEVRGAISFPANDVDDFVLRRGDGRPTYNFAVVVDDVTMAITHVIRGAGHLSNTPKQALIFDALEAPRPVFVHLPNVLAPDGGKLSKRHGAAGVRSLREQGYLPEAVVNYLSLLGWSHPEEREILTVEELIEAVDLARLGASETAYDPEKLRWVAQQHLARLSQEEFMARLEPFLDRARFSADPEALEGAVRVVRSRMATLGEINEHLAHAWPVEDDGWTAVRSELGNDPGARGVLNAAVEGLEALESWDRDSIRGCMNAAGKAVGVRGPALFHPLRKALTGVEAGPDLAGLAAAVGRDETLRRLRLPLQA